MSEGPPVTDSRGKRKRRDRGKAFVWGVDEQGGLSRVFTEGLDEAIAWPEGTAAETVTILPADEPAYDDYLVRPGEDPAAGEPRPPRRTSAKKQIETGLDVARARGAARVEIKTSDGATYRVDLRPAALDQADEGNDFDVKPPLGARK